MQIPNTSKARPHTTAKENHMLEASKHSRAILKELPPASLSQKDSQDSEQEQHYRQARIWI